MAYSALAMLAQSTVPTNVAVMLGLASPIASIGVAWITLFFTNRRESQRQDHEQHMQQAQLNREQQAEKRKERFTAYQTLAKITRNIEPHPDHPGDVKDLSDVIAEIELLAASKDALEAAEHLVGKTIEMRTTVYEFYQKYETENDAPPEDLEELAEGLEQINVIRDDFIKTTREELGEPLIQAPGSKVRTSEN